MNYSTFLVALVSVFIFHSCNNVPFFGHQEGKIIYDVTFPYELNDIKLALFPSEITCIFDGEHQHTPIESGYGIVKSELIIDQQHHETRFRRKLLVEYLCRCRRHAVGLRD
jgi:hypothetical protein